MTKMVPTVLRFALVGRVRRRIDRGVGGSPLPWAALPPGMEDTGLEGKCH
jgi:hypothetical protein